MRIAAGVLVILMSLWNGCIGAGLTILGGVGTAVVQSDEVQEAIDQEQANAIAAGTTTEAEVAEADEVVEAVGDAAGLMLIFGIYLIALFGLQIAAGVCLFISKAAKFIIVVGVLGLVAVGLSFAAGRGFEIDIIAAIVVSVLVIIAGMGIGKAGTGEMAPAPPA